MVVSNDIDNTASPLDIPYTRADLEISSAAFGAYGVMALFTVWEAVKHTRRMKRPWRSLFIYMVWTVIAATLGLSIVSWLTIRHHMGMNRGTCWAVIVFWALEIHLIMQIILNRLTIIAPDKKFMFRLKIFFLVFLLLINISVVLIWIPARMEVSEIYIKINHIWDPVEIALVIFLDMCLQFYFIYIVKKVLLGQGLKKYGKLITTNVLLMTGALLIDVIMIGVMFVPNAMLYLQIFPLAYIIKTRIELEMATCILRIAQSSTNIDVSLGIRSSNDNTFTDTRKSAAPMSPRPYNKSPTPTPFSLSNGTSTQPRTVTDIVGGLQHGAQPKRFSGSENGVHVQKDVYTVVEEDFDLEKGANSSTSGASSIKELVQEREDVYPNRLQNI